ncbi:hypothetical protein KIN20_025103 [Parelaphostrongylus tenuis]|uniref:Uncharacterized protein n=1 Tax=Parelaphostrongylus tenuis TaxID=148309 RepID=A0AAD5N8Y0_PARTN|nr:hypothetical protein KIN20_025103 [Parelaphostrongylus tenuis]
MNVAKLLTVPFMSSLLAVISTVSGCGVILAGQRTALLVSDVVERQARSALLPDTIISTILSQFTVNITYEPMECPAVCHYSNGNGWVFIDCRSFEGLHEK